MVKRLNIFNSDRSSTENFFRKLSVTNWLIIINSLIFLISFLLISMLGEDQFSSLFALQANNFFAGRVWIIFTSMFLHANIEHIFFNMISLFFVGNFTERLIGRKRFFWFYMVAGLVAGLFYVFLSYFFGNFVINFGSYAFNIGEKIFSNPSTYAVGASGAIFGVVGLLAMLVPYNKVYLIAGPLIAIIVDATLTSIYPTSSIVSLISILLTVYVFISIFVMFSFNTRMRSLAVPIGMSFWLLPIIAIVPLVVIGLFVPLPIGNTAHFGGLIAGLGYGLYLKKKYRQKTTFIRNHFKG